MKISGGRVRFLLTTLSIIFVAILFSVNAFAISKPGLDFEFEYRPEPQSFPESLRESNPAVYEAHKSLLHFPDDLKKLESQSYENELAILQDSTIDNTTKQEKLGEERIKHNAEVKKLKADKAEMRKTFLFLATDALKNDANPDIMLSVAQQYYDLRNQKSAEIKETLKTMAEEATKAEEEKKAEETKIAETDKPTEKQEEAKEPVKMIVKQPTGNPSLAITTDQKSNLQLVVALCKEIIDRFPSFEYMSNTHLLLASAFYELGKKENAVSIWKSFLKNYKGNKHEGEVLYQLANYEFKSTKSFDHYTTASEIYSKTVKYFKPGKTRWRVMYKYAWATYLSPDLSEDSKTLFVKLYKEMAAQKKMSEEMMLIKVEILEVIRQISGVNRSTKSSSMFGK